MSTSKRVALVTGASSGIGREIARIHAARGGNLVIVARSREGLRDLEDELQDAHSSEVHVIAKDLSHPDAAAEVHAQVRQAGIAVDYLVNNAGFGGQGKFHERHWADDLAMINLNVIALTALTRMFLPEFVDRDSGRILNVSSIASLMPGPLQAVYFATKAYVTSFSNAIAEELHDTHVTVTALLPGATETEFARVSGMEESPVFAKAASARGVAQAGYDGMLAGKLNVLAGVTLAQRMMLASVPFAPKQMALRQVRKMQEVEGR